MRSLWFVLAACGALAACGDPAEQGRRAEQARKDRYEIPDESIFDLFRASSRPRVGTAVSGEIWRASLDTLSFLPLESVDPFSGVIVTGWGRVAGDPTPFKATVYVNSPALDARSLKVAAFRQSGGRAVPVSEEDNRKLEDAILTRARQLRIAASQ